MSAFTFIPHEMSIDTFSNKSPPEIDTHQSKLFPNPLEVMRELPGWAFISMLGPLLKWELASYWSGEELRTISPVFK